MHFFWQNLYFLPSKLHKAEDFIVDRIAAEVQAYSYVTKDNFNFIEVIFQVGLSALFQCFGQPADCWVSLSRRQGRVKKTRHHVLFLGADQQQHPGTDNYTKTSVWLRLTSNCISGRKYAGVWGARRTPGLASPPSCHGRPTSTWRGRRLAFLQKREKLTPSQRAESNLFKSLDAG